jgi:ATP-dependent DNA helicase RecQ
LSVQLILKGFRWNLLMKSIAFFDLETSSKDHQIFDIGCVRSDGATFHENSISKFLNFINGSEFICGHNVFKHDLKYIHQATGNTTFGASNTIDTLYLSPLLFPRSPYHRLIKDDKLQTEELNNPLNDSIKARELFFDEVEAYDALNYDLKSIFYNLLSNQKEYAAFFRYVRPTRKLSHSILENLIRSFFTGKICEHSPISRLIVESCVSLAYALALVNVTDKYSLTPPWVLHNFPDVERLLFLLRNKPCITGCTYCNEALNPFKTLKRYFGYDSFRSYGGEPLQEKAVYAAVQNKSLLAVFPTGGGKSITFQVPALMAADNAKALTVIISPLQSLMKDQVDNLEKKHGITEAVTINGLLNPVERQQVFERMAGSNPELALANILYLSPESLRSVSIQKLLINRKIARFVIDEAHCFSSWGQDFRVDYLYIGDFIKALQTKKGLKDKIPVSCFTATAKQKVIEDIKSYFKDKLDIELEVFRANASRTNLQYKVFNKDDEEQKYAEVRRLLETKKCPSIIYVSRTKRAYKLAQRLCEDGFDARPYHGKMDKDEKTANQNAFIEGEVDIMVATSAFGMGVDKSNVGMVIHYEISDSLENYVQEAGRAGRDETINADCYVLFNEDDLDKHFILLNQTKLDQKEINQIWKAIKDLTKTRDKLSNSALEIARKAGWDDSVAEIETRVKTAIAALEDAGYIKRGQNMPRVFANSILAKTAQEAIERINLSEKFAEKQKEKAIRIIKKLFSSKSKRLATEEGAESRIDYISDHLGIVKEEVIQIIQLLRDEKILADAKDLTAFIKKGENSNRSLAILEKYRQLEAFFFSHLSEEETTINLKELNEQATEKGCKDASPNKLKTVINFWVIKNWVKRKSLEYSKNHVQMILSQPKAELAGKMEKRHEFGRVIVEYLFQKATSVAAKADNDEILIEFSVQELREATEKNGGLFAVVATNEDIEDTLVYLSKIEAIKIEGGFLVVYNSLTINRLENNNKIQYKLEDYQKLSQFYQNKVQQIHIVGEYAKKMIENYNEALQFVDDYFRLNYTSFLNKYFPGSRQDEIKRTLTPAKFQQLFGALSLPQFEIINDSKNKHIVVAAGPGSGKTRVLVHKLASLLLTEDVKHEQLLMLTFSRAAATEFKKRLLDLIGNAANYVEIKTFHSYCFDLVGRVGNLEKADSILQTAVEKIKSGDIEPSRITKAVLVVDEAQDMNVHEFALVKTLMEQNEEMRVVLVGDDDQNIYEFRGSDSKYMQQLISENGAKKYELLVNYRSKANIVSVANQWASQIPNRLKDLPIMADDPTDGNIQIVQYGKTNLITPLVESIKSTDLTGSTCILTRTNDEAAQITGLLTKAGYAAKLIQSNDGFHLYNLQELRFFTDFINRNIDSPIISDEDWEEGIRELNQRFQISNKLDWCRIIIKEFELSNPAKKYKSDWKAYLLESKFEDFIQINGETIYVSTIHKAKGKEFENVFVVLDNFDGSSDECRRQLYVAMTRAKTNLSIHYNQNFLSSLVANQLTYTRDTMAYEAPKFISCLLTHRNVQLGYFEFVQHRINGLTSGATLTITPEGLATEKGLVIRFSNEFTKSLHHLNEKGYQLVNATANFVVHWLNNNNEKEVKIILPEITFKKSLP